MKEVNKIPKRQRPRWPFCGGRWTRSTAREVRVVTPKVYRQRRRPQLPVQAAATGTGA